MLKRLPHLFSWLVALLVFFIPSNLFLVLKESAGYVNGLRIDYLLPKLFLTDLLIIAIIVSGVTLYWKKIAEYLKKFLSGKSFRVLVILLIIFSLVQFFSVFPLISFYWLIKIAAFSFLALVLFVGRKNLNKKLIYLSISISLTLQAIFASYHHLFQKSLTPYWLLGESKLSESMIGLARGSYGGAEHLLAYGTTPHPNILAGISVLLGLILIAAHKHKKNILIIVGMALSLILFLTQSWSALFALLFGLYGIYKKNNFKSRIIFLVVFLVTVIPFFLVPLASNSQNPSIIRREALNSAAIQMFFNNPVIGIGLGNFTAVLEKFLENKEFVRFIQPAHNAMLLILAETGALGILLLATIIQKINKQYYLEPAALALIPLLALDHYLITTQSGVLTLIVFLLFFLNRKTLRKNDR